MKEKKRLKVLVEIDVIEEESKKYSLPLGMMHVFTQDRDDPKIYLTKDNKKVSEAEVNNYEKYSNVIRVVYASNTKNQVKKP